MNSTSSDRSGTKKGPKRLASANKFPSEVSREYWHAAKEEALKIEFSELSALDLDFEVEDMTGFTIGEIDVVLHAANDSSKNDSADEIPHPLPDGESVSRPGDIWLLGKHRLLCGNALIPEDYQRLMQGKQARMVFTDPPYNIPIENNVSGLGKVKHRDFAMGAGLLPVPWTGT